MGLAQTSFHACPRSFHYLQLSPQIKARARRLQACQDSSDGSVCSFARQAQLQHSEQKMSNLIGAQPIHRSFQDPRPHLLWQKSQAIRVVLIFAPAPIVHLTLSHIYPPHRMAPQEKPHALNRVNLNPKWLHKQKNQLGFYSKNNKNLTRLKLNLTQI